MTEIHGYGIEPHANLEHADLRDANLDHARGLGYNVDIIAVRARCDDVVTCGRALRTRKLEVIG